MILVHCTMVLLLFVAIFFVFNSYVIAVARNNQVFHDQPSFKIWDSDDDLHHENDDFKKEITPAHLVDSYQVIPDSYSPNPVLRNKVLVK